jgi:hypothetical protein
MSAFNRFEDDPGTGSALSSSGVIAQQAPALPVNTAPGSAFNRFEDDDGSTTSAQSIVNADETAVRQTREELIASARAKEEQQAQGEMVVFTDDEERILAELAIPVFEPTAEYYEQSSLAEDENPYYEEAKARGEAAVKMYGGTPANMKPGGILAIDPNSRVAKVSKESAETEAMLTQGAADAQMTMEEYFSTQVFPNMEDGAMKSFFQTASDYGMGEEAFSTIMGIGSAINYTSAGYTDVAEAFFTNLQKESPAFYDAFMETVGPGKMTPRGAAESFARETGNFITYLETLPVIGMVPDALKAASGLSGREAREVARNVAEETSKFKNINSVILAEKTTRAAKRDAAKAAAAEHTNLTTQMIKEFEQQLGARSKTNIDTILDENLLISRSKGDELILDPEQYRAAGAAKLVEQGGSPDVSRNFLLNMVQPKTELTGVKGDIPDFMLDDNGHLTVPVIKAENLDSFVAVAAEVMQKKGITYDPKSGKRLVDVLFELSVDQEIMPEGELLSLLNKYDLSFEEYATMMVGSASEAGQVLNKFSQISRRVKPKNELDALKEAQMMDMQGAFARTFRRIENIRRGLLVSQVATAARNLSSGGVRAPLEGLQNVLDTALYNYSKDGMVAGVRSLGDVQGNWADSFRHMKYMFDPRNYGNMKEYTDYILKRPELSNQFDMMFNQINEVRRSTGAGTGGLLDGTLTLAEKGVDVINFPNRWQEYLIRRGTFTAELERLVKREYGVELIDVINDGRFNDLLNDAPELVGTNKTPFKQLISDSVDRALDITYAKQPDTAVFRELTSFITRNGLTTVAPFPRFMFNSMELAAQYSGGAFAPAIRRSYDAVKYRTSFGPLKSDEFTLLKSAKSGLNEDEIALVGKKFEDLTDDQRKNLRKTFNRVSLEARGPLTGDERKQISRNIIGATVILPAAMMYRNSEDAPSDYKTIRNDDDTVVDISSQSPILRQALWLAEWNKRKGDGSLDKWMESGGFKEGVETFVGANIRAGGGAVIFQDVSKMFSEADAIGGERGKQLLGELLGEYASTFLTPLNQVIETQRAFEFRPNEYLDLRSEPNLETEKAFGLDIGSTKRGFLEPFRRRGYTTLFTPSEEKKAPLRETIFQEGNAEPRVGSLAKVFTGITQRKDISEAGKFLSSLGFMDYKIRPRTISPGFQRYETKVLREVLPSIVEFVRSDRITGKFKDMARMRSDKARASISDEAFIRLQQTDLINDELKIIKSQIDGIITAAPGTELDNARSDLTDKDGNPIDVRLTEYLRTVQKFRRLPPDKRRAASVALPFLLKEKGPELIRKGYLTEDQLEPSLANEVHLELMLGFAAK